VLIREDCVRCSIRILSSAASPRFQFFQGEHVAAAQEEACDLFTKFTVKRRVRLRESKQNLSQNDVNFVEHSRFRNCEPVFTILFFLHGKRA